MKAIMYHYVREFDILYPEFKFLHINDFIRQIDYFQSVGTILHPDEILRSQETGVVPNGFILTFDDGLKDHYKYVMPQLLKRGLSGIFYVPTGVYATGKILDVHRIHLLLGKFGGKKVYDILNEIVTDSMLSDSVRKEFHTLTYKTQINDNCTEQTKRILNYFISYSYREQVLDTLMEHLIKDERALSEEFYISCNEMKEMHDAGFLIGSHTVSHPVMSKLNNQEQLEQISSSFDFISKSLNNTIIKTFCYPYGGFHSFTDDTESMLTLQGCKYAFNVEPRDIIINDLQKRPQALPRYDCNLFPNGKIWNN